jgi:uncharacterized cysteine cluster protein YcgN (CxxCxxCC family)
MGGSFSVGYSPLNENQELPDMHSLLNDNPQQQQQQQQQQQMQFGQNNNDNNNKSHLMDKAYDEMMKQRGLDNPQGVARI